MPPALEQLRHFPPTKLWRLLVYNPESPKNLYQQFDEEPGSLQGMINGLNRVIQTWQQPLTLDYIVQLHDIAVDGVFSIQRGYGVDGVITQKIPFDKGLRNGCAASFGISNVTLTPAGTFDLLQRLQQGNQYFWIQKAEEPDYITIPRTINIEACYKDYYQQLITTPHIISCTPYLLHIQHAMQQEIQKFLMLINNTETPENKLLHIVSFLHTLELIHGFYDGNCRTFGVLLLLKLLIEHNLPLSILHNPNTLDGHGPDELKNLLIQNQQWVTNAMTDPTMIEPQPAIHLISETHSTFSCSII